MIDFVNLLFNVGLVSMFDALQFLTSLSGLGSDGTSLVVSDEVGQVYIFGTGSKMSEKDVKYDQVRLIQSNECTCLMERIEGCM